MVTPTRNARTQRGVTPTFEPRLRLRTVFVSGKPDFKARDNSAEFPHHAAICLRRDHSTDGKARQSGAFWRKAENSQVRKNAWWAREITHLLALPNTWRLGGQPKSTIEAIAPFKAR